jgi:hypothetical protein
MFKKIHIDFDFTLLLDANYSQHAGSCIKHQVHEILDVHEKYGGFPASYNIHNTLIHQLWWGKNQIDYDNLGQQLGMEVITVSTIKQPPGCVVPFHRDTFFQIKKQYPDRTDTRVRANIYLEDYKMGQFIQYELNDKFETSTNWKSGDGFLWTSDILHLSANAGFQDKYTLQVSGFLLTDA